MPTNPHLFLSMLPIARAFDSCSPSSVSTGIICTSPSCWAGGKLLFLIFQKHYHLSSMDPGVLVCSPLLSPTGFLLAPGFLLELSCLSEFSFLWLFLPHACSSLGRCLLKLLPPPFCSHPLPAHFLYGTHPQACATVSHFLTGLMAKAVTGDRC